jgi:tRNA (mo5U34)-methyltransferase
MSEPTASPKIGDLREQIIRLGPWHLDVQVTPDVSTRVSFEALNATYPASAGQVSFISPRKRFLDVMRSIYPLGLQGRSVMDCACNCGGYLFWAKEFGAGDCLGFDVREHWIDQARFLAAHRTEASDRIRFDVCDLYDLPKTARKPSDITIFKGIFYHLPDPITGLKIAADLTRELFILNTATRLGLPDGMLAVAAESPEPLMSGVYGLNWFPTGPQVLEHILKWMGFAETRLVLYNEKGESNPTNGRVEIIASRTKGFFANFDAERAMLSSPSLS